MKAYHIPYAAPGFRWHRTQEEAKAHARAHHGLSWELTTLPENQVDRIAQLNKLELGSAVEAREDWTEQAPQDSVETRGCSCRTEADCTGEGRCRLPGFSWEPQAPARITDEAFEALPLAYQLHLATLALENARNADLMGTAPRKAPQRYDK